MIEFLEGELISRSATQAVVRAGPVALLCAVSLSTSERLPSPGKPVRLWTHLHIGENDVRLFGFAAEDERLLFRSLLGISGVGPATALKVLSGVSPDQLRQAITTGDTARLRKLPGIGPKTAERLVIELKDALGSGGGPAGGARTPAEEDALKALVAMQMPRMQAEEALARARAAAGPKATWEALVRAALAAGK